MKIQDPAVRAQAMRIAASATPPNGAETLTVTVDGRTVEVPAGASILEAAKKAGRRIPTLCHHPDLPDAGVCRVCVVEVSGPVSYTHLRAHETVLDLVCRLLL